MTMTAASTHHHILLDFLPVPLAAGDMAGWPGAGAGAGAGPGTGAGLAAGGVSVDGGGVWVSVGGISIPFLYSLYYHAQV